MVADDKVSFSWRKENSSVASAKILRSRIDHQRVKELMVVLMINSAESDAL